MVIRLCYGNESVLFEHIEWQNAIRIRVCTWGFVSFLLHDPDDSFKFSSGC